MKILCSLLFFLVLAVQSAFGVVAVNLTPSADFYGDRIGFQIKGGAGFPVGSFFIGPAIAAFWVSTNDFTFQAYSLGASASLEWKPFPKIPFFVSPEITAGAGYAVRSDKLGLIDGLFGFAALAEIDLDYAFSGMWRAGLGLGTKWLLTPNYSVWNLQCGLHLSCRLGGGNEKTGSIKR